VNVGTYTIIVTGTDSKNESTSTSFQVDVQKNYVPVVQKQVDDQQIDLGVAYNLTLDRDTFVDPNGDSLTYSALSLPKWLTFNASRLVLAGMPREYGTYNITLSARDAWGGTAVMGFEIVAGIRPNTAPVVGARLTNSQAYVKELYYYKFPANAFNDSDGDTLFYLVS
jgi:large repetitive protein